MRRVFLPAQQAARRAKRAQWEASAQKTKRCAKYVTPGRLRQAMRASARTARRVFLQARQAAHSAWNAHQEASVRIPTRHARCVRPGPLHRAKPARAKPVRQAFFPTPLRALHVSPAPPAG